MLLLLFATAFAEFRVGECWAHSSYGSSKHSEMIRIVRVSESKLSVQSWHKKSKEWDRPVTVSRKQVSELYEPVNCPK